MSGGDVGPDFETEFKGKSWKGVKLVGLISPAILEVEESDAVMKSVIVASGVIYIICRRLMRPNRKIHIVSVVHFQANWAKLT